MDLPMDLPLLYAPQLRVDSLETILFTVAEPPDKKISEAVAYDPNGDN